LSLNPSCAVNSGSVPATVAAGATVTIALAFPAGANFWGIQAIGTDETSSAAAVNASLVVNQTNKTATFTAPATTGAAVIFQSTVGVSSTSSQGAGRDVNGALQPSWTTTFKVNVATPAGLDVVAVNETIEQNAAFGWIAVINAAIRLLGSGGTFVSVPSWVTANASTPGNVLTLTNAQSGSDVRTDTTGGTLTKVKLPPSPTDGTSFQIIDATGQWGAHSLVVDGNGNNVVVPSQIGGTGSTAATITVNLVRGSVVVKWDATNNLWQVGIY
jgi:hypothetical protein